MNLRVRQDVWRFWPDEDEWQRATVTDWDAETGEHLLVYNQVRCSTLCCASDRKFRLLSLRRRQER